MKRVFAMILLLMTLTGCKNLNSEIERALALRNSLLQGNQYSFDAQITADYGDDVYSFGLHCSAGDNGDITFNVTQPQSISGISGIVSEEGGKITFDDQALLFELLADGQLTPVSAPWLMIHALRGGYIRGCGLDGQMLRIQLDDSYEDDAIHIDVWTDENDTPVYAEFLWKNRRIISMNVENFTIL